MASLNLPGLNLNSQLGSALVGNTVASVFYGITCIQTYLYFRHGAKDSRTFRALIAFLWLLDTAHIATTTHLLYYTLVSSYGDLAALIKPAWSVYAQIYLACVSDLIIRGIFGKRAWLVARRSYIFAGLVGAISLTTFVTGLIFAARCSQIKIYWEFHEISYLLYTALSTSVAADFLIAGALCVWLSKERTGFRRTDSLLNILMIYSINSSLLTGMCAAACFITYAVWPNEFTYIGIYFSLSKLYLNSLLATLNGRQAIADKISGVSELSSSAFNPGSPAIELKHGGQSAMTSVSTRTPEKYRNTDDIGLAC